MLISLLGFHSKAAYKMPQLNLYVDETTHDRIRRAAKAAGMSLSRWVATVVTEKTADQWPDDVLALAGTWKDLPSLEEIRAGGGSDASRELI